MIVYTSLSAPNLRCLVVYVYYPIVSIDCLFQDIEVIVSACTQEEGMSCNDPHLCYTLFQCGHDRVCIPP